MSVIAIDNVPNKLSLKNVVKLVATTINGRFEVLNFLPQNKMVKKCYIHLSEKLDPWAVVERINNRKFGQHSFYASIPDVVPDLPLSKKPRGLPKNIIRKLKISPNIGMEQMVFVVRKELVTELLCKYPSLAELNYRCGGNKLMKQISQSIMDRLLKLTEKTEFENCFKLSQFYRKNFPHSQDGKFIETIAFEVGAITESLTNDDLKTTPIDMESVGEVPLKRAQEICEEYGKNITEAIMTHINYLQTVPDPEKDPVEEAARIKVRKAFQKLKPFVPEMIRTLIQKTVVPDKETFTIVRIYGEPFLPGKEHMQTLLKRFKANTQRSQRLYNLLTLKINRELAPDLYALDSTVINGCTIIVRPLKMEIPRSVWSKDDNVESNEHNDEEAKDEEDNLVDWDEAEDA